MKTCKTITLFLIGGAAYYSIEILYRGFSHPTMFVVGGLCFVLCGLVNEVFTWDMSIQTQQAICAGIITSLEFVSGIVLNLMLHLNIWDYSNMPFNVLGQICLPFVVVWFFLSAVAIVLDDYIRYFLWGEERPHYCIRGGCY